MAHPAFLLPHRVAGTFPNDPKVPDQPRGRPPGRPYCYAIHLSDNSYLTTLSPTGDNPNLAVALSVAIPTESKQKWKCFPTGNHQKCSVMIPTETSANAMPPGVSLRSTARLNADYPYGKPSGQRGLPSSSPYGYALKSEN